MKRGLKHLAWAMVLGWLPATTGPAAEPSAFDWRRVLELPAPSDGADNALLRWQRAIAAMPMLEFTELLLLDQPPDQAPDETQRDLARRMCDRRADVLAEFTLRPGEVVIEPPESMHGIPLVDASLIQQLVALKRWQVRLLWWDGERDASARAAVDLIELGTAGVRNNTGLRAWLKWLGVMRAGCDAAWWIARQIDVGEDELRPLGHALAVAAGTWPAGMSNALRGEYGHGFRPLIERLPETNDVAEMLGVLEQFGLGPGETSGARALGHTKRPLLDGAATLEAYGRPLAEFIEEVAADPNWRHRRFVGAFEHRADAWAKELGAFGDFVFDGDTGPLAVGERTAIQDALRSATNPIGKLLVPHFTPNIDAITYAGVQAEAQRRCIRLLVEWRMRVVQGAALPATADAWAAAGLAVREIEDPFTGRLLHFDTEHLRVWSVGLDGVNNGGRGDPEENPDGSDFAWSLTPATPEQSILQLP